MPSYFITGANKGLGFELASVLSADPKNTVFATTRELSRAIELTALAKDRKNLHVVILDASKQESIDGIAAQVSKFTNKLDVLISNAAISDFYKPLLNTPRDIWDSHYALNTAGPVFVTQALYPFLSKGTEKTLVYISSAAASMAIHRGIPAGPYGSSKAAINHIALSFNSELKDEGFRAVAVHPGVVDTQMLRDSIQQIKAFIPNIEEVFPPKISPLESATLILKTISELPADSNGKLINYKGDVMPW